MWSSLTPDGALIDSGAISAFGFLNIRGGQGTRRIPAPNHPARAPFLPSMKINFDFVEQLIQRPAMFVSEQNSDHPKATSLLNSLLSYGKSSENVSETIVSRLAAISDDLSARLPSRGYIKH